MRAHLSNMRHALRAARFQPAHYLGGSHRIRTVRQPRMGMRIHKSGINKTGDSDDDVAPPTGPIQGDSFDFVGDSASVALSSTSGE